jgi:hypothetical protein
MTGTIRRQAFFFSAFAAQISEEKFHKWEKLVNEFRFVSRRDDIE